MKAALAFTVSLWLVVAAAGPTAAQTHDAPTAASFVHGPVGFSFVPAGNVADVHEWPDVRTPRKFSMQIVMELSGEAQLFLMVFDLRDKQGDWWLSEVMGFLFQPEVGVTADVTARGYETYILDIPGEHGIHAQREALVVTPEAAFRFTCYRCGEAGELDTLDELLDSFEVHERGTAQ